MPSLEERFAAVQQSGGAPQPVDPFAAQFDPNQDVGPFQAAMIAAGRQVYKAREALGGPAVDPAAEAAFSGLREQRPISTFAGGMLPWLPVRGPALASLPLRIASETGVGAGTGYLASGGEAEEALAGGAVSGGVYTGLNMAGRVAQAVRGMFEDMRPTRTDIAADVVTETPQPAITQFEQGYEQAADDVLAAATEQPIVPMNKALKHQYTLTPAARTGDPVLEQMEAGLARNPMTSRQLLEQADANMAQLSKNVTEAFGFQSRTLDPDTLNRMQRVTRETFNRAADQMDDVQLDPSIIAYANDVLESSMKRMRRSGAFRDFYRAIDRAQEVGGLPSAVNVRAQDIMDLRSMYTELAKDPSRSVSMQAQELISDIDDAINAQAGGEALAMYKKANEQFRLWLSVFKRPTTRNAEGVPNPRSMLNSAVSVFQREMGLNTRVSDKGVQNALDAIRTAAVIQNRVPNSGTPTGLAFMAAQGQVPSIRQIAGSAITRPLAGSYVASGAGEGLHPLAAAAMGGRAGFAQQPESVLMDLLTQGARAGFAAGQ